MFFVYNLAKRKKHKVIELDVHHSNKEAIGFYVLLGFVETKRFSFYSVFTKDIS